MTAAAITESQTACGPSAVGREREEQHFLQCERSLRRTQPHMPRRHRRSNLDELAAVVTFAVGRSSPVCVSDPHMQATEPPRGPSACSSTAQSHRHALGACANVRQCGVQTKNTAPQQTRANLSVVWNGRVKHKPVSTL